MKIKYFFISALVLIFTSITLFNSSLAQSSNEIFSTWQTSSSLPYPLANYPSFVYLDRIYAINGSAQTGASKQSVISSVINSDGSLVSWNNINADTPDALILHASVIKENKIYVLGGKVEPSGIGNSVNYVWVGNLNNDGSISSWTTLNPLHKKLSKGKAVIVNNRIYFVGGATWTNGGNPVPSDSVYFASINADGTIGNWQTSTATGLPTLLGHGLIEANGKITTIGGSTNSNETPINKTYSATVNADGTLGNWSEGSNLLPTTLRDGAAVKIGAYAIYVGGYSGQFSNKVYYSAIDNSGNLGAWTQSGNNLPIGHCCGSLAVWYNRLYLSGGHDGSNYINSVYTASTTAVSPPPTPTPTPTPLTPLVVLPGMGGSWNYEAIVHNTAVADTSWTLTPLITVYDGLITTLKNSGYTEGTNLWIYYYDWRKSISDTATNLASFITSKNLTSVNLIGHSQGGLIARKYAQDNSSKINKLVTIASPHSGALPAFKIWEGADFSDLPAWQNLLIKLYLRINRKSYNNDVATIQAKFPNLQNILPTFEYFNSGSGTKSNFLGNLNFNSLYTISGTNLNTPKIYNISSRGTFDKLAGKWANGKPTGVTNASGDGTVLLTSGQVTNALENSSQSGQDHQVIVSNSTTLAKIQSILGISGTVSTSTQASLANALIITAASPVNFTVTTPANATLTPTENLLIVNNPSDGNYTVNITPNGAGGAYTVYFGKIKGVDWAWEEASDNITSGIKTHVFGVQMAQAGLGSTPLTNALSHTNDALTAVGSNTILKQDVLRIKSYVNDLNTSAAQKISGFDLRAGILFSTIDTLTNKAKNTSVTESLRLLKSDVEQLRGDRFGN